MSTSGDQPTSPVVETTRVGGPDKSRTIGEIVASISEQFSRLVRDEFRLAQAQLVEKGKKVGAGAAALAVAAVLALYALGVLIAAAVLGLATALPAWLSALIIGVVLLVVAGVAAFVGKRMFDASKDHTVNPQEGLREDLDAVKKGIKK
ncbi:MAG: phage holin family protein [Georgenia sp.]